MTSLIPMLAVLAAAAAAVPVRRRFEKRGIPIPWIFVYLTFVLPFAAGGFHTYTSAVTAVLLLANLAFTVRRNRQLRFVFRFETETVLFLVVCFCISPLWAADKGMAVFGIVRYLPLGLYILTLMQYPSEVRENALALIPLSGAAMVLSGCVLLLIPGMEGYVTVNGRLCGFLQYPNTFAAFLLCALVLSQTGQQRGKAHWLTDAVLILGILLSGSQTGFLLLIAAFLGIALIRRSRGLLLGLGISLAAGLILAVGAARLGLLANADRITDMGRNFGSLLVRLLYYKDALPVILKNPFGLGYLGYRALEGTFQTGRYSVSFVHNGLLQLLLDVGWAPALCMAAAFLRGIFSKTTAPGKKLLLVILLGHCMLDFDLQFFVFWVMALSTLDFDSGSVVVLRKGKTPGAAVCAVLGAVCIWLGAGELLHSLGQTELCLAVTPFHTDALAAALQQTADPEELDALADRILEKNSSHALAYSAKANAAYSRGQVLEVMEYKEQAIRCARYSQEEYCDYFEKLYSIYLAYLRAGDSVSAAYCARKLRAIPEQMQAVSESTDPLAYRTEQDMSLELPEIYAEILIKK